MKYSIDCKMNLLGLLITVGLWVFVSGEYELQVTFHRFDNSNQRCAECHTSNGSTISFGCCDDLFTGDQCTVGPPQGPQCDVYFVLCQGRSLGTSNDSRECPVWIRRTNSSIPNTDGVSFRTTVTGYPNPVTLEGSKWVGTQFYMEFMDDDSHSSTDQDDLIDTLAIDVDIPVGGSISHTTYTGRFNNAQVDLSFQVVCAENYYGPDCTRFCNDSSCPCEPGYTGEFCEINIDDCVGINCSGNGQCKDDINFYTCSCHTGFTGQLCETNIDDCEGVTCSGSGECIDGVGNYSCVCELGFTGEQCETDIDECVERQVDCNGNGQCKNGKHSYTCDCNPGYSGSACEVRISAKCMSINCSGNGQCVDATHSFTCQCNSGYTGELCETTIEGCIEGGDTSTCTCNSTDNTKGCVTVGKSDDPPVLSVIYLGPIIGGTLGVTVLVFIFIVVVISLILKKRRVRNKENIQPYERPTVNTEELQAMGGTRFYIDTNKLHKNKPPDYSNKFHNPMFEAAQEDSTETSEPDRETATPIYADVQDGLGEYYAHVGPVYATLESESERAKRYAEKTAAFPPPGDNRDLSESSSSSTPDNEEHYDQPS